MLHNCGTGFLLGNSLRANFSTDNFTGPNVLRFNRANSGNFLLNSLLLLGIHEPTCAHFTLWNTSSVQCQAGQATVNASSTSLDVANKNFKILTDPPTQDAIDQDQAAIDSSQQQYYLALKPYTDQDVAQERLGQSVSEN